MQIHQIKPQKRKKYRRVGRGGTRGNYSGKGKQGQNARAGSSRRPAILDFIRKIPKLRGVPARREKKRGVNQPKLLYQVINLDLLDKRFNDGETVSPQTLLEKRLVRRIKGRMPSVKILGRGEMNKKFVFEGVVMSENVKLKMKTEK